MELDERIGMEQDHNLMVGPQLALAPLKRLLQTGTQHPQNRKHIIGKGSDLIFREVVENYAKKIADESAYIAHWNGRLTIKPEDIEFAVERIEKGLVE